MPQYNYEVGAFTRVTALLTGVQVLTSAPCALLGISVAAVLTGQIVQLWHGRTTGVPVIGTCTLAANTFTRLPVALPAGLVYCVTNEDVDLTIYWQPMVGVR